MGEVRLGTSGWSYKEWEGPFYPKGEKKKLTYYSKFYDTVEIDSTFYAYPSQGMILGSPRARRPTSSSAPSCRSSSPTRRPSTSSAE